MSLLGLIGCAYRDMKPILALILAGAMLAGQTPVGAPAPVVVQKKVVKKKGGKGKWIAIGVVAAAAVVVLVAVNVRLGNEGKGIF